MAELKIKLPKDVELNSFTVDQVLELANQAMAETIDEQLKITGAKLQQEALKFISAVYKLEKEKELFREKIMSNITIIATPQQTDIEISKQNAFEKAILQKEYYLAFEFEKYLDAFRKAPLRSMIYVAADEKGIIGSYEMTIQELVNYIDSTGSFNNIAKAKLTLNGARNSIEENAFIEKEHVQDAKIAYAATYDRLEQYYIQHQKNIPPDKKFSKANGLLMWKRNKDWIVGNVLNYGDVKEAYIAYLFDSHESALCKLNKGNPPYYSHSFVGKFFNNYISKVDNMAAIREEDVKTKNKQYGVKGSDSGLPSLQQYYDAALAIVDVYTKRIDKAWIEKLLTRQQPQKARRNLERTLDLLTGDEFEKLSLEFS